MMSGEKFAVNTIWISVCLISLVKSLAVRELVSIHEGQTMHPYDVNPSQPCRVTHSQVLPGLSFIVSMNLSANFCEWTFKCHSSSLAVLDVNSALCMSCDCGFFEYGTVNNHGNQVIYSRVCSGRDTRKPLISSAVWLAVSRQENCVDVKSCLPSFHVDFIPSEYHENQLIVQICFFGMMPILLCVPLALYCIKLHRKAQAIVERGSRGRRKCFQGGEGIRVNPPQKEEKETADKGINKRLTKHLHKMKSLLQQRDSIDSMADNIHDQPNSEIQESMHIQLSNMPPTPRGSMVIDLNDLGTPVQGEEATVGSYVSFDGFIGESDVYSSQNEDNSHEVVDKVANDPAEENKHFSLQPEIYCPPSPESFLLNLNLPQDDVEQTEDILKGCSGEINVDADSDENQYACALRNKSEEMKRLRSPSLDFRATEVQHRRDMSTPEPTEDSVKSFNSSPVEVSPQVDPALEAFPILRGLASFSWGGPSPADFCPHLLSPVSEWNEFFTINDSQC